MSTLKIDIDFVSIFSVLDYCGYKRGIQKDDRKGKRTSVGYI